MKALPLRVLVAAFGVSGALAVAGCGEDEGVGKAAAGGSAGAADTNAGAGGESEHGDGVVGGAGGDVSDGGGAGAVAVCGEADVTALVGGTWDARFTIAGVTGHDGITPSVYDFALEPDGSVLAAGRFAYHEGKPVTPLLRLRDGKWQPAHETWSVEPPGDGFAALAANDDGVLALATGDSFGERAGEIWIDQDGEQTVIASFVGQVRSLVWFAGKLYAAGSFQLPAALGGMSNLGVWDGQAWAALPGGPADGPVLELLVADGSLYVGGAFTKIGGVTSANVAAFDGADWTSLPLTAALAVYALARSEAGELYAGGVLGDLDAAGGVVKRVGNQWQIVGGGLGQFQTRGVVSDLVAHDGVVDVSGCFSSAGGLADAAGTVAAVGLARWDGEHWQSLNAGSGTISPWFQPGVCGDEGVGALWDMEYQRLGFARGKLFAGGSFAGIDGVQTQSLAVREDDAWTAQGEAGMGLGGSLDRVVTGGDACELYGLGQFTHLGGKPSPGRVARFSEGGWQLLKDDLPLDAYCPALDVSPGGELVVACMTFPEDGGPAQGVLLHPSGDELVALELDKELPPVQSLKWDASGKLWVAGGDAGGFVATIQKRTVSVVSEDFDGPVQFLDVRNGDDVLAAGTFANVGDVAAQHIAHYVDGEWSALGDGLVGQPQAIARDADRVYASTYNDGQGAFLLGAFDGDAWTELAGKRAGLLVEDFYSFNQILPVTGGLLLVGTADLIDGSGRGALLLKDGKLQAVGGGGVHAISVSGAAVARDSLWIGGIIAEASSKAELTSSVGVARLTW